MSKEAEFGKKIKGFREEKGLTQKQVAYKLGIQREGMVQ